MFPPNLPLTPSGKIRAVNTCRINVNGSEKNLEKTENVALPALSTAQRDKLFGEKLDIAFCCEVIQKC